MEIGGLTELSRAFSNIDVKKKTSNYIKYYNNNNLVGGIVPIASTIRLQLAVQAEWAFYIYIFFTIYIQKINSIIKSALCN